VNLDAYKLALAGTGRLKMRALALLAEGTPESRFEAAVLLHEVARAEQRAIRAIDGAPPEVRLASAVERCWCLLEGLDPRAAGNAYGDVLAASKQLPIARASAFRARLEPKFKRVHSDYATAMNRSPTFRRDARGQRVSSAVAPTDAEVGALLRLFPGTPWLWFQRSLIARRHADAWKFIRAAAKLEPDDNAYLAGSLRIASQVLPKSELEAFLDANSDAARSPNASADVCLFFAFAQVERAASEGGERRAESLRRALDACLDGESRAASIPSVQGGLRPTLFALRLAVAEELAGRTPNESVLYQAGLGTLAVTALPKRHAHVIALLRESVGVPSAA
jgi:hypothetical protein